MIAPIQSLACFLTFTLPQGLVGQLLPPAPTDAHYHDEGRPSAAKVELGRFLFFDKILSGNRNISCATCHHPTHGTSDGLALPLGEGPQGLGPERRTGKQVGEAVHTRIPRNSPALFNKGAKEFVRFFHDGRVEVDTNGYYESGFISPAKWKLPQGLDNALAAQAMFPVTSADEMAGHKGENEIADAVSLNRAAGPNGVWALLTKRLTAIPEYVELFRQAYPQSIDHASDIQFTHAANALAAFQATAFRADNSPFDAFLRGKTDALTAPENAGMKLFYGRARCADCHSGTFQTDHQFHAIAMPQLGPGKGDGNHGDYWRASGHRGFLEDYGRGRVTGRSKDNYKFRTPSLRNVATTGPWGHSGAFNSLKDVVKHHLNPEASLQAYDPSQAELSELGNVVELTALNASVEQQFITGTRREGYLLRDTWVQQNAKLRDQIAQANELPAVALSESEIDQLVEFLTALTDPMVDTMKKIAPERVPSGLPVND